MEILSQSHVINLLIVLLEKDRMYYSELTKKMDVGNFTAVNLRISKLKAMGLVDESIEDKFGGKRYIWLTHKGKKVAEKLIEIEKILKEK